MRIRVHFYSYFKELTECEQADEELPAGSTVEALVSRLHQRFPRLEPMAKSTRVAVGVEYQNRQHVLQDGDEVSLFPPVQGG